MWKIVIFTAVATAKVGALNLRRMNTTKKDENAMAGGKTEPSPGPQDFVIEMSGQPGGENGLNFQYEADSSEEFHKPDAIVLAKGNGDNADGLREVATSFDDVVDGALNSLGDAVAEKDDHHPFLGPLTLWMNNVHFITLIIFLVICDIVATNFEILHSLDWLQHKPHINDFVSAAAIFSLTILCIFAVEIMLRCARHPSKFFYWTEKLDDGEKKNRLKKFNVADMGVVYVSLILEVVMKVIHPTTFCKDHNTTTTTNDSHTDDS